MISSKEGAADASTSADTRGPAFGWATSAPPAFAKGGLTGYASSLTFLTAWSSQ